MSNTMTQEINNNVPETPEPNPPAPVQIKNPFDEDDFLKGSVACTLDGDGTCEACQ